MANKYDDQWYDKRQEAVKGQIEAVKQDRAARAAATDTVPSDDELGDTTNLSAEDEAAMERAALAKQEEGADDTVGQGYTGDGTPKNTDDKFLDQNELKDVEKEVDKPWSADDETAKGWYSGKGKGGKKKGFWTRRKKAASLGLATFGVGGLLIGFMGVGTVGRFMQWGDTLDKIANFQQEKFANSKVGRIYRALKPNGTAGNARLTWAGGMYHDNRIKKLGEMGIKVQEDSKSLFKSYSFDTAAAESPYKGLSGDALEQRLIQDFGNDALPRDKNGKLQINKNKRTGGLTFRIEPKGTFGDRKAIRSLTSFLGQGRIMTALTNRDFYKYHNASLNPIKRLTNKLDKKANDYIKKKKAAIKEALADRAKRVLGIDKINATLKRFGKDPIKPGDPSAIKSGIGKAVGVTGLVQTVACPLKAIADTVNGIRYASTIQLTSSAMDMVSVPSQIQAGDVDAADLELYDELFNEYDDKGNIVSTAEQSAAFKASLGDPTAGVDLSAEQKQSLAPGIPSWLSWTQNTAMDAACSDIGVAATWALSTVLTSTGPFGMVANFLGGTLVSLAISPAMNAAIDGIAGWISGQPIDPNKPGTSFGNTLIYGAKIWSSTQALRSGGKKLPKLVLLQQEEERIAAQKQTFESQSLAYRLFSKNDPDSLVAKVSQAFTGKSAQDTLSVGFSGLFSNIGSALLPQNYALAAEAYNFPMDQAGFTDAMLNDDSDPTEGYERFTEKLSSDSDYVTAANGLAENCWGGKFVQLSDGSWTAQLDEDSDVEYRFYNNDDYDHSGCASGKGSITGQDFQDLWDFYSYRISAGNAEDCYYFGNNEDCGIIGIDYSTDSSTSGSTTASTADAGYGATTEQLEGLPDACKTGTATGSVKFLCVGAKYRNLVPYLEFHPYTGKAFSEKWASGERDGLTLDCSLFIGTVLWDAYGVDLTTTSGDYVNDTKLFEKISISDAQPGDFFHAPGHIGIVLEPGKSILDTGWVHPTSPVDDLNIHSWNTKADYALRYIGPGADT